MIAQHLLVLLFLFVSGGAAITWVSCPASWNNPPYPNFERLSCTILRVPLDWVNDPDGEQIDYWITRISPSSPSQGNLVILQGGPGTPATALAGPSLSLPLPYTVF